MIKRSLFGMCAVAALTCATVAQASFTEMYMGSVTFFSDAQAGQSISLPSFDTMGGTRTLLDVQVDITHSGRVDERGDNDDPFKTALVQGRMIRQFALYGPGVTAIDNQTINGGQFQLAVDNGDGMAFDPTPPDGVDFGTLQYMNVSAGSFFPNEALYATPGPNSVVFNVPGFMEPGTFLLMVNDQQFIGVAPDQWQLEVQNPNLVIKASVTYTWIPEPMTLSLLGVGALALRRFRK